MRSVLALALVPAAATAAPLGRATLERLPLDGVPLDVECDAAPAPDHPILRRYPGEDAHDLAGDQPADAWVGEVLCSGLRAALSANGAHDPPPDVRLAARARLDVRLDRLLIEGARVVEERVGRNVLPVAIPHWALAARFDVRLSVVYSDGTRSASTGTTLQLEVGGAVEQDDYVPLRLRALLDGAATQAFDGLPRLLADDGQFGDLLFALVERPPHGPGGLADDPTVDAEFWQLLSTSSRQRHDAMAIVLESGVWPRDARVAIATWFLLNDPDRALRVDALGWLLRGEPEAGSDDPPSDGFLDLVTYLLMREPSGAVRAAAVRALHERPGERVRTLLIAATADPDREVADRAQTGLRKQQPPTTRDLESVPETAPRPALPAWTAALDGRVPAGPEIDSDLLRLARAAGGEIADAWTARWVKEAAAAEFRREASALLRDRADAVRDAALSRLEASPDASLCPALRARVTEEPVPDLRARSVGLVGACVGDDPDAAVLAALADPDPRVRAAAIDALPLPGVARATLEALASSDPDRSVRRRALRALRRLERSGRG